MGNLTGAKKYRNDINEFLAHETAREGQQSSFPTISTKNGRFPAVLASHLMVEKGIISRFPEEGFGRTDMDYPLLLANLIKGIENGKMLDSGDLLSGFPEKYKGPRFIETAVFDILYGALQFLAYYGDDEKEELFSIVSGLARNTFERRKRSGIDVHVDHFKAHAGVFVCAESEDQDWEELYKKTVEKLESWGDPPPPESIIIHAAHNIGVTCRNMPNEDSAYDLVKKLRKVYSSKQADATIAYEELNSSLGWREASEIVRILWPEQYRLYYRYNRNKLSEIISKDGAGAAMIWSHKSKFVSPEGIPYIKSSKFTKREKDVFLSFPGGTTIGNSSVLVKTGETRILLDYGSDPFERLPMWSPDIDMVDAVFITHAHHDHVGGILSLYFRDGFNGPWYVFEETRRLAELALRDCVKINTLKFGRSSRLANADVGKIMSRCRILNHGESVKVGDDVRVKTYRAGHVPGSCQYLVSTGDTSVLYTGDFNFRKSFSVEEMEIPEEEDRLSVGAVITEGTYAFRDEESFVDAYTAKDELLSKIRNSGNFPVLLPVLSLGRAQEVLHALSGTEFRVGVFGLALKMTIACGKAYSDNIVFVDDIPLEEVKKDDYEVIVSSSGCLQGGPSKVFFENREWQPVNTILTGYIFPGTPARQIAGELEKVRYSAHSSHDDWFEYMSKFPNADKFLIHYPGDRKKAEEKGIIVPRFNREYRIRTAAQLAEM
jgi:Cft2 family RNA processing exonuclease